jgi:hypothetical protein
VKVCQCAFLVLLAAKPVQAEGLSDPAQMVLDTVVMTWDCAIDHTDLPQVQGELGLSDEAMDAAVVELYGASLLIPGSDGVFRVSNEEACG